jgi:predicted molibdopterin-dependent oxidoreductase YjgC
MSEEQVNIEVNGIPLKARKGAMLIEITDAAGIPIPRFCYHKKLSIAASCRMCLVEVEKAPKPLPACATPVMEGMKVYTESPKALRRAERDHGVPADQSSAGLPDLRPGWRVRATGCGARLWR